MRVSYPSIFLPKTDCNNLVKNLTKVADNDLRENIYDYMHAYVEFI